MKTQIKCLFLSISLILAIVGLASALCTDYYRPAPLMDYVSQEQRNGTYDITYNDLNEHQCRKCHGNSTADRHHGTPMVVRDVQCLPCHPICTPGSPDCPNGITIHRDCLTSGCHSWDDVQSGNKKWHHVVDLTRADACTSCHNPNLVDELSPLIDFNTYQPQVDFLPTPFSCENCHWEQTASVTGNPNAPGHPSTYDHRDYWGNLVGFYEYGKPISNSIDTHHMGFDCTVCHPGNPNNLLCDDPMLIRYCERCHSIRALHTIGSHVSEHNGWGPVGLHASADNDGDGFIDEDPNDSIDNDLDGYIDEDPPGSGGPNPLIYWKWGPTPYAPHKNPGFTADQQCFGCHGGAVPGYTGEVLNRPVIDISVEGMQPTSGNCGAIITLIGEHFGSEHIAGREVQIAPKIEATCDWSNKTTLPIHGWTDKLIEWELPGWQYAPGNYCLRVKTEEGVSNKRVFTVKDTPTSLSVSSTSGPCSTWLTIFGAGCFGNVQNRMFSDGYHGIHHVVDFVASSGEYTATIYRNWSDTSLQVRLWNLFGDRLDECSIDPLTEQPRMNRNFVQDIGDENADTLITCDNVAPAYDECTAEPVISRCNSLSIGVFNLYVKAIYFGDDDGSGGLSCGDTIFEVEKSDPVCFELTDEPYINGLNPKQIVDPNAASYPLLKIYGGNFGQTKEAGDSVRMGTKAAANSSTLGLGQEITKIPLWSNTLIKVRVNAPNTWRGKTRYVWVEKGGNKSNYKPLAILAP